MLLDLIRTAVRDSVTDQTGAVLSGGIDSSTIVSLAGDIPTFTGWYDVPGFDEREYARLAAKGEHTEILITPQDFIDCFDEMARMLEPPFQGPGSLGQWVVARFISEAAPNLTRILSGEGGDELFGGYARLLMVAGEAPPDGYENYLLPEDYPRTLEEALAYDWERLPDLLAVDTACLGAFAIEAVAPFTDPRVVDHVLSLPAEQRVGKKLLRQAMRGIVPDRILARTDKMGMPAPFVQWAQGPLRDFIGDRIGYVPDPDRPWDRGWWYDMIDSTRVTV